MTHLLEFTRSRTGLGWPQTARLVKKAVAAALAAEGVAEPCAVEILLTAVCSYVTVALAAVLVRRIPKVGKILMG